MAFGTFFILIGGLFLLKNLGLISEVSFDLLWPAGLIALGVFLVSQKKHWWGKYTDFL